MIALSKGNQAYAIHSDQLNTPRMISDSTQQVVWRWDSNNRGQTTLSIRSAPYRKRGLTPIIPLQLAGGRMHGTKEKYHLNVDVQDII